MSEDGIEFIIDRYEEMIHKAGGVAWGVESARAELDQLRHALVNARPDEAPKPVIVGGQTCKWTHETDPDFDCWHPACNADEAWSFDEKGPEANHCRYCMYCGKPIEVVEQEPEKGNEDEDEE